MKRLIALIAMVATHGVALAADDKPKIEDLFKPAKYALMRISPDGKYLAALAPIGDRQNLIVIDVAKRDAVPITSFPNKDVVSVSWINSKRLLFGTGTIGERVFDSRWGALFAVDRDATQLRVVSEGDDKERNTGGIRFTYRFTEPVRFLPGETDDIIVQEFVAAERTVMQASRKARIPRPGWWIATG